MVDVIAAVVVVLGVTIAVAGAFVALLLFAPPYTPPTGGPRTHRLDYVDGRSTVPLTNAEAYGLWHVFHAGPDRAVTWWHGDKVKARRA